MTRHGPAVLCLLQGHLHYLAPDDRLELPDITHGALVDRAVARRAAAVRWVLKAAIVLAAVGAYAQMAGRA